MNKLIVTNCDSKAKITLSSLNLVSDSTADDGTLSDIFGNLPSANFTMPEDVKIQYTTYIMHYFINELIKQQYLCVLNIK